MDNDSKERQALTALYQATEAKAGSTVRTG